MSNNLSNHPETVEFEASPDIFLREIDTEHMENVEENREAVGFTVRLSSAPIDAWRQEFEQAYLQTPYTLKPPVEVRGDTLHVIYLPRYAGELPDFFRFLALMVKQANEETHRTEELHTSNAQERHKSEFRRALKSIELPRG